MQPIKIAIVLALALPPTLGVTACATTRMAGEESDDMRITGRVGRRLTADPEVRRYEIDVDTIEGVVTLRGKVDSETMKSSAERIAVNTEGVKRVVNELVVDDQTAGERISENLDDAGIKTRVGARFTADPDIRRLDIDIDVTDGVVTLSGIVADDNAKSEAERVARGVEGVQSVKNELQVSPQDERLEPDQPDPGTNPSSKSGSQTGTSGAGTTTMPKSGTSGSGTTTTPKSTTTPQSATTPSTRTPPR